MTMHTKIPCLICRQSLEIRPSRGRKSGKPSLMVICPADGRHFRGFINDQVYVKEIHNRLQVRPPASDDQADADMRSAADGPTRADAEGTTD